MRSGRGVTVQGSKCIKECMKLAKAFRVCSKARATVNAIEQDMLRCATGIYNYCIKSSHVYDVISNPNYKIGKPFPYILTYRWLKHSSNELDKNIEELLNPVNTTTNDTSSVQSKTK